jgi:hypothetical protein
MSVHDIFFGPLNKNFCVIFYIFTIISFLAICVAIIGGIGVLIDKPKLLDYKHTIAALLVLFNLTLVYFIYRLFNTMCIKSL